MRCEPCDFDQSGPVPAVPGDLCPRCGDLLTGETYVPWVHTTDRREERKP